MTTAPVFDVRTIDPKNPPPPDVPLVFPIGQAKICSEGTPQGQMSVSMTDEPEFCAKLLAHFRAEPENGPDIFYILTPDAVLNFRDGAESIDIKVPYCAVYTTFIPNEELSAFMVGSSELILSLSDTPEAKRDFAPIFERNKADGCTPPNFVAEGKATLPKDGFSKIPKALPQPTFIEARQFAHALSDGRDQRNWKEIEGVIALLHSAPDSEFSVRLEPSALLIGWWGTEGTIESLRRELSQLDLDDIILFRVILSAILHDDKARFSASLDDIINLIGRDTDARRSSKERVRWRTKVWRSIVLFDSLALYGARSVGRWLEPGAKGTKRARMKSEALFSRDPLLRIVGTRDTDQGTFDGSAPPKTVSLVPGEWLMPFHGNREVLSEFGDVIPIAQIPRGKPKGAWAACAGLMLTQLWREQATKAQLMRVSRGGDDKIEVLKFRPFTRRELLSGTLRSGHLNSNGEVECDVSAILSDKKNGYRALDYWKNAVKELKTRGVIGHYAELQTKTGSDWREDWLDQPLDIRPAGEMLLEALVIHKEAKASKKRSKRALHKTEEMLHKTEEMLHKTEEI